VSYSSVSQSRREMVASLLGREPGNRGTFAFGSNVTENTGLCVIAICGV
jgi:hypothetical protein